MTTTKHKSRAHSSVVGGSSAARVGECPGSVELSSFFPTGGESSEYAEQGTALHEASDHILMGRVTKDRDVIGLTFNEHEITEELYDNTLAISLGWFDDLDKEMEGLEFEVEQRVKFKGIDGAFGTADIIGRSEKRTVVLDWKFGEGVPVFAENNKQLMFYAYAASKTPGVAEFFDADIPIELIIAQPRGLGGSELRRWTTSLAQLEIFAAELVSAADVATDPLVADFAHGLKPLLDTMMAPDTGIEELDTTLRTLRRDLADLNAQFDRPVFKEGEHCRWCIAKTMCPIKQINLNLALNSSPDDIRANLGHWLDVFDELETVIKDARAMGHTMLEEGLEVEGRKLISKRATLKWIDEEAAFQHFKKMRSVLIDDVAPRKLMSAPKLRDFLHDRLGKEMPDDLAEIRSSGTTMARSDAKGDAIVLHPKTLQKLAAMEG